MPVVLAVSAHPDDDSLFAGGALARWASQGYDVYTLCTTRGEGGEVGEPPIGPKERLGELREAEERRAAAALGERDVFFLDYVDPHMEIDGVACPVEATLDEFSSAVRSYLRRLRPSIVITHGTDGEYGHPQHVFTHQAVREAIRALSPWRPEEFVTWMAHLPELSDDRLTNQSDPASLALDISPWFERKVAAALCHRSQHAMFLRNSRKPSVPEMVRRVEPLRSWAPELYLRSTAERWPVISTTSIHSDW